MIFFAYEYGHNENTDAITKASKELNKPKKKYKVTRWEDLSTSGRVISADIFEHINKCDRFACDLTYLNHNVLFELGYAIARQKKLKIFLNPNITNAKKNYSELKILKNIGYKEFSNSKDISQELQKAMPAEELPLLGEITRGYESIKIENDIFLINIKNKNQAAMEIEEYIKIYHRKFITNNEDEIPNQTLKWYLSTILKTKIILLHMLGNDKVDYKVTNAEYSLYAGLAYGLDKKVLVIAPAPYHAPIDYTDILIEYDSSEDCVSKTLSWVDKHLDKTEQNETGINVQEEIEQRELNLLKLGIGDGVAEKDGFTNIKTFVEIDAYAEAMKRKKAIITGRKGSGKTEIFMRLKEKLGTDKNNYNIIIKPDSDEMLSNAELTALYYNDRSKKAFLKTVWQYVVLSKIFVQIFNNSDKAGLSEKERERVIAYYADNKNMFDCNFYSMVLYISKSFQGDHITEDPSLLEKIKKKLLPMISIIQNYFENRKYQKITILADNLDTGWESSDLKLQSLMISCLLEYVDDLYALFGEKATFHSVIFLRKDIFNHIMKTTREPDKMIMDSFEINWNKFPNQLKTVIDKRIEKILDDTENINEIWQNYFSLRKNPFDMVLSYIVKRPRDAIYFISRLFESAVTNDRKQVTEEDFKYASDEYTKYLYGNLIAELKAEFPMIENILRDLQRVYKGILTQFTFIPVDDFYKIIQKQLDKDASDWFVRVLMEGEYLVAMIKNNNYVLTNYEDLVATLTERKFKFFKKNKVLFNMKLIPFVE